MPAFCLVKVFAYDYCFWSMDESETEKFAGQFLEALYLFIGFLPSIHLYGLVMVV